VSSFCLHQYELDLIIIDSSTPTYTLSPNLSRIPEITELDNLSNYPAYSFIKGKEREHYLNVVFSKSQCQTWGVCTWCDDTGEIFFYKYYPLSQTESSTEQFEKHIWDETLQIVGKSLYFWRIILIQASELSETNVKGKSAHNLDPHFSM
jgi:hypothetical protein